MKTTIRTVALVGSVLVLWVASAVAQDRVQIVRAEYGTGHRFVDVTPRVQSLVRDGVLDFRVSHDSLDADPAEGHRKELRLQVRDTRGHTRQMIFVDSSQVHLYVGSAGGDGYGYGQGLQITSAQYGAQHMADVTARLAAMVRNGQLTLRIAYDTVGVDPDEGRTKHIVVNYTYNGVPGQVTLRDGETLNLPGAGNGNGGPGTGTGQGGGALTILRAEYGTGTREFDVTRRLASLVRGNSLQLRVTNDSMGGDPAEHQAKWIDVWYSYNNRAAHARVHEQDVITLPGDADYYQGRLQVTRAQYGADYRFVDVTTMLNSQIQNDQLNLRVTNDAMGGDPARGERKVLTVFYIYNGQQTRAFANENDLLSLPLGRGQGGRGDRDDDDDDYYRRYWPGRSVNELRVLQASWGAEDRNQDVTGRLNGMVRGNQLNFAVNTGSLGGDPAPGAPKRLRVIYMLRGLRYETNVPEGGSLMLP
jgi:hypothetical protein